MSVLWNKRKKKDKFYESFKRKKSCFERSGAKASAMQQKLRMLMEYLTAETQGIWYLFPLFPMI